MTDRKTLELSKLEREVELLEFEVSTNRSPWRRFLGTSGSLFAWIVPLAGFLIGFYNYQLEVEKWETEISREREKATVAHELADSARSETILVRNELAIKKEEARAAKVEIERQRKEVARANSASEIFRNQMTTAQNQAAELRAEVQSLSSAQLDAVIRLTEKNESYVEKIQKMSERVVELEKVRAIDRSQFRAIEKLKLGNRDLSDIIKFRKKELGIR